VERLRYASVSATAKRMLAAEGESGRFEFKQTSDAVKPSVLVAAANWVALDPSRESVTVLVGVAESKHPDTGLVTGEVIGLVGDLDKHIDRIQQYSRSTFPVPVDIKIIEEGANTSKPFLRVVVTPSRAPHFDDGGRRVTRHGASTRAITDDELLELYLDREAEAFERRFRRTANELATGLESVASEMFQVAGDVNDLGARLEKDVAPRLATITEAAWSAAQEAEESRSLAEDLQTTQEDLAELVRGGFDRSTEGLYLRLRRKREFVWQYFSQDSWTSESAATTQLASDLQRLLERRIDPWDWAPNFVELNYWEAQTSARGRKASLKWWRSIVDELTESPLADALDIRLTDVRAELRELASRIPPAPTRGP
jgi:hypothetical protein